MSLFPQPGPQLPSFKTLLIKGNYHPSAPIHLSLSCLVGSSDSQAIIITPSRQAIALSLQSYNDDWLALNSGRGDISLISSRTRLFYPPSPAHLCLLLSMFRVSSSSDVESRSWLNSKTTLAIPPSLVILHEPSAYFLSEATESINSTLSSYMSLVTHALSSVTFLSDSGIATTNTRFALFDSKLDQIRLPIFRQPTQSQTDESPPLEPVAPFVQRYFEWMGVFDLEEPELVDTRGRRNVKLYRSDCYSEVVELWQWWETPSPLREPSGQPRTRFIWSD